MCYSQLLLSRARFTQGVSPVPRMGPGDGSANAKSKKSLCLGSPRGFCSHGWWRAKRRASLVLDGYWFDVLAEWNILCILKLMLHVQHRIWLLGVFVLLSGKHMQPTSFVLLALDLARSV